MGFVGFFFMLSCFNFYICRYPFINWHQLAKKKLNLGICKLLQLFDLKNIKMYYSSHYFFSCPFMCVWLFDCYNWININNLMLRTLILVFSDDDDDNNQYSYTQYFLRRSHPHKEDPPWFLFFLSKLINL